MKLTKKQAAIILDYLKLQFPWINDPDANAGSGADVIELLAEIGETLEAIAKGK